MVPNIAKRPEKAILNRKLMFYYYSVANSLTKWLYRVPKWVTAHGANTQRSNMIQGDCSRWTPHRNLQRVADSVKDFIELLVLYTLSKTLFQCKH